MLLGNVFFDVCGVVLKTDWKMRFKVNLKQFIVMRSLSDTVIKNVFKLEVQVIEREMEVVGAE